MKNKFAKSLAAAAVLSMLSSTAMAEIKIATVDMRKLVDKYYKRPQAEMMLKEKEAGFQKDEKSLVDDFKKGKDDYDKLLASANDQSVTPAERDKRKTAAENKLVEMQTLQKSIRTFEETANEQLETLKKRLFEKIVEDIRATINVKAKAAGCTMVIDSAADSVSQLPILLYNNGENDMTDAILTQLNLGAPAANSSSTAPDAKK